MSFIAWICLRSMFTLFLGNPAPPVIERNVTETESISLEWTAPFGCYGIFTVEWRRAGSNDKWSSGNTIEKTFVISDLTAGTEYDLTLSAWRSASASGVPKTVTIALKTKKKASKTKTGNLICPLNV